MIKNISTAVECSASKWNNSQKYCLQSAKIWQNSADMVDNICERLKCAS